MSRKLLAFLLSDFSTLRLLCKRKGCGGIIEAPIAKITPPKFAAPECPVCGQKMLMVDENENPVLMLARAAAAARAQAGSVEVELVLEDDG